MMRRTIMNRSLVRRSASRESGRSIAALVLAICGAAQVDVRSIHQKPFTAEPTWATRVLRAGMIGTDTSHVPAFAEILRSHPEWKIHLVAAFKGGSPDLATSANRVEGFAKTAHEKYGVEFVETIDALLTKVDVVLLTSVDGRAHLAQVTPVLKAGKPVFMDKPVAASLEDVHRIVQLSRQTGTPFFSSSSFRFHPDLPRLRKSAGVGQVSRVEVAYALSKLAFHPDLFYYGIHGVEALFAVMGTGCRAVSRRIEGDTDITTCTWSDGRVGVYRGMLKPGQQLPLVRVWGEGGTAEVSGAPGYEPMLRTIAEFFHTRRAPFDVAETIEIFEFMTAADESKERNGAEVSLATLRK
jgi:predicted dehydrogenase